LIPFMRACCFIFYLLLCSVEPSAQINLVPNSSFEAYEHCPWWFSVVTHPGDYHYYLSDWYAPTQGSSDYYHACRNSVHDVSVPYNIAGYLPASDGEAYAGIFTYATNDTNSPLPYREYLQVALRQPLVAGKWYCVSFKTVPLRRPPTDSITGYYAVRNLGAYLSPTQVMDMTTPQGLINLPYTPQIVADRLLDGSEWTQVLGTYQAQGGERWLTIGNFDDNQHTQPLALLSAGIAGNNLTVYASYYFIDDVHVFAFEDVGLLLPKDVLAVCETDFPFSLSAKTGFTEYRWSLGDTVASAAIPATGWYWAEALVEGCIVRDSLLIISQSAPTVELGPDLDICEQGQIRPVTLKNSTALENYYWSSGFSFDTLQIDRPGTYRLTTQNACGTFWDEITLLGCETTLFCPNVITPDAQNENAVFLPQGRNITLLVLEIYDHRGRMLYREQNPDTGWNGEAGGHIVAPGLYIWHLRYRNQDSGAEMEKYGDVTVLR
jgi:hypothetical protein